MKYISGSISKALMLALALALTGTLSAQEASEEEVSGKEVSEKEVSEKEVSGKDTLRTYGPRFGIDLSRFLYLFLEPNQTGAEINADFEIYRNVYPVFELGYNNMSDKQESFDYTSTGTYGRAGIDYNILGLKDRSAHHTITVGFRYGMSIFKQRVEGLVIPNEYWGDFQPETYENNLTGHWIEMVGGMRAEVFSNFFMGWTVRYKILLNPDMDPVITPEMIPGFGTGGEDRAFGFTYTVAYKIPLFKK